MKLDIPIVEKPDHVGADKVVEFDLFDFDAEDGDCQRRIADALQAAGVPDVFWTPCNTGHWVAARGEALKDVLTTPDLFSSSQFMVVKAMNPEPPLVPLMLDPPAHALYRALLAKAFVPEAVEKLGEKARTLAVELIEGFLPAGECEFIGDFATQLPVAVFMSLVDWPDEDRAHLLRIAEKVVRPATVEDAMAGRELVDAYARNVVETRRCALGDDLISDLLRARIEGAPLSDDVLNGMVKLLLTAGLDTVASSMGFYALHLARNAPLRAHLVGKPADIPRAVDELLRRYPIGVLGRIVTRDCEFHGAQLKAGDTMLAPTMSFGLDDRQFDRPTEIDLGRSRKAHLSFGAGPHRCVGALLATIELRVFLEEWLRRIPEFQLKPGEPAQALSGYVIGIPRLRLVWPVG
ncbi:MAG: cytochrome P450 [Hyphomonadaceae bacterium]|nr:cytochrome P450 [Hyphomonadaceae bacterium]